MKALEKRMYFFVPYNLSPIQQAIQAGHAAEQFAYYNRDNSEYNDYVENWKTWIILNGGTTNKRRDFDGVSQGTLNQIADSLSDNDINFQWFEEPDLNDALTAVCFLVDERVFNYEDYPDFHKWIMDQDIVIEEEKLNSYISVEGMPPEELKRLFPGMYPLWVSEMGGNKNVFLRELLRDKRLA